MTSLLTVSRGPLMIDMAGAALDHEDIRRLNHPLVGGVILFTRNYQDRKQLQNLTATIKSLRPALIIAVDHEGGRVQRFRQDFSSIPPMRSLAQEYDRNPSQAQSQAHRYGQTIAQELTSAGISLNFAPVLDLDYGHSSVIGDRAFHSDPLIVATLTAAFIRGLRAGGLPSVGKHFPGHGYVEADSHHAVPVDQRSLAAIWSQDLIPYRRLISQRLLDAVMPAHVIYPQIDQQPAGFSSLWLQQILRRDLNFSGLIFSDDLAMAGAEVAGDILARADAALNAGCDMLLTCNRPDWVDTLLSQWQPSLTAWTNLSLPRLDRIFTKSH